MIGVYRILLHARMSQVRMRNRRDISRSRVCVSSAIFGATRRNACDFHEIKLTEKSRRLLLRVNRANIMATPTNSSGNLVDEFEEAFQVKHSNFNFYCGTCAFLAMKICVYKLYICVIIYAVKNIGRHSCVDNFYQVLHIERGMYKLKELLQNNYLHNCQYPLI